MTVDNRTANYDWPKPHPSNNPRSVDVPRLEASFDAIDAKVREIEPYPTIAGMGAVDVPAGIGAIRINGRNTVGDGEGGLFVDVDNGSTDTFLTGDGRTWYRSLDHLFAISVAATRTALKAAIARGDKSAIYLLEDGREGQFTVYKNADLAASVLAQAAQDTREAIYIQSGDYTAIRKDGWAITGIDIRWFGIVFDDQSAAPDNTAALQAAMNMDWPISFPDGTIYVSLVNTNYFLEGGSTYCALIAKSNTRWIGQGKLRSIIKMRDGESTDASPKYANLMASNAHIQNCFFKGIGFDLNGANNPISPNRGSGVFNAFNWAALMISGSIAVGTFPDDARLTNCRFTECAFLNSPGVTTIACAQTNANADGTGTGSILGKDIEIDYCLFWNNGIDSNDHSSIYGWANNVRVHHNQFLHPTMSTGSLGPLCPMELHGSDNFFDDNIVWGYYSGPYICGNFTAVSDGQYIRRNVMTTSRRGILLFVEIETEPGVDDVHIDDNRILLTNDAFIADNPKWALNLVSSYGAVGNIYSRHNTVRTNDTYGAYGLAVGVVAAGKSMGSFVSEDDTFIGFSTPIAIGLNGAGAVGSVDIIRPRLLEMKANTTTPTTTIGIYAGNTQGELRIVGTRTSTTGGSHPAITVLVDAVTLPKLTLEDNVGHVDSVISDNATCNRRFGSQATTFADYATVSARWPSPPPGSKAQCSDGTLRGTAGTQGTATAQHTLEGWRWTGADWNERREPTGG